eukprot:m.274610 g.274610  ORF g.274610 m.274610 type:complete len:96 (-) comp16134_c0_seq33:586-873(-)
MHHTTRRWRDHETRRLMESKEQDHGGTQRPIQAGSVTHHKLPESSVHGGGSDGAAMEPGEDLFYPPLFYAAMNGDRTVRVDKSDDATWRRCREAN